MNDKLKNCPFCGSKADGLRWSDVGVSIHIARCANDKCLASRSSVDAEVWNARPDIIQALDTPELELLMRRFSVASQGERREAAKQAVMSFVARAVGC